MKKLERKARFDKKRKEEADAREEEKRLIGQGEVTMKDVESRRSEGAIGGEGEGMDVDKA